MNQLIFRVFVCVFFLSSFSVFANESVDEYPGKNSKEAEIHRGSIVFQHYCMQCHGEQADGKGRRAKLYNPPPSNLIMSEMTDTYKELIIRKGGKAVSRSEFMPPWGEELTDEQVTDVVAYLRKIVIGGEKN